LVPAVRTVGGAVNRPLSLARRGADTLVCRVETLHDAFRRPLSFPPFADFQPRHAATVSPSPDSQPMLHSNLMEPHFDLDNWRNVFDEKARELYPATDPSHDILHIRRVVV